MIHCADKHARVLNPRAEKVEKGELLKSMRERLLNLCKEQTTVEFTDDLWLRDDKIHEGLKHLRELHIADQSRRMVKECAKSMMRGMLHEYDVEVRNKCIRLVPNANRSPLGP